MIPPLIVLVVNGIDKPRQATAFIAMPRYSRDLAPKIHRL